MSQGPPACLAKVGNHLAARRTPASGLPALPGQQGLLCYQKHSHVVVDGGAVRMHKTLSSQRNRAICCGGLESCQQLRLGRKRQRVRSKANGYASLSSKPLQGCRGGPIRKCFHGWGAVVPTINTAPGRVGPWSLTDSLSWLVSPRFSERPR